MKKILLQVSHACKKVQTSKETHVSGIYGVSHDLHPTLEGCNLEEGEVGPAHVVKLHVRVDPHGVVLLETGVDVRHDLVVNRQPGRDVKALATLNR